MAYFLRIFFAASKHVLGIGFHIFLGFGFMFFWPIILVWYNHSIGYSAPVAVCSTSYEP